MTCALRVVRTRFRALLWTCPREGAAALAIRAGQGHWCPADTHQRDRQWQARLIVDWPACARRLEGWGGGSAGDGAFARRAHAVSGRIVDWPEGSRCISLNTRWPRPLVSR